jgi:acetate kinase
MEKSILTINGGSSSIKFALYSGDDSFTRTIYGRIERIGLPGSVFVYVDGIGKEEVSETPIPDMAAAIEMLSSFLESTVDFQHIVVVGHRIVHGMDRKEHAVITPELVDALKVITPIDPEHLPLEIALIELFAARHPELLQVACFDTVFHSDMPRVAQILPLPRRFDANGVRRYGFHGLSYTYLLEELRRRDPERANGRVIMAHLGNGASTTAIKEGKSMDTSMGFTPAGGIPMSSRTGDIDPGALLYVMESEGISPEKLNYLINHESGLLGISETTADMHDLLDHETSDVRAKEAVDLFCYAVKKQIGAYAAALGGVETLVFSGGMGEHAPRIRARICEGLEFLGIVLDSAANEGNNNIISAPSSSVTVRVMQTNEELMIARIAQVFVNK